ncbi:hypothetical protein O3W44_23340 [Pantoea sp. LMR881]|uniref:hypothetical protein n=1 Tax=Pantoea sp. LMR881 TaxID=3014336 RepID=UPI0022B05742|nr:hypothetical protein [Pantoea sp. LMR881]MCZ4061444.1 hypothetical protein [Pantoea sp. LMR881]
MKSAKAKTLDEVNQKLHSGDYKEVIVDFDISSDDFFSLSDYWCERGAKIKKEGERFLVKLSKNPPSAN